MSAVAERNDPKLTWGEAANKVLPIFDRMSDTFAKHAIEALLHRAPRIVIGGMCIAFLSVMVLALYAFGDGVLQGIAIMGGALSLYMILSAIEPDDEGIFAFSGTVLIVPVVSVMLAAVLQTNEPDLLIGAGVQAIILTIPLAFAILLAMAIGRFIVEMLMIFISVDDRPVRGELRPVMPDDHMPDALLKRYETCYPVNTSVKDALKNEWRKVLFVGGGAMAVMLLFAVLLFATTGTPELEQITDSIGWLVLCGMMICALCLWAIRTLDMELEKKPYEAAHRLGIGVAQLEFIEQRKGAPEYDRFNCEAWLDEVTNRRGAKRSKFYGWKLTDAQTKKHGWFDSEYKAWRAADRVLRRDEMRVKRAEARGARRARW